MGWIRSKLRTWLLDPEIDEPYLDAIVPGEGIQRFYISGSIGLRLIGRPIDDKKESSVRLIGEGEAIDKKHFQALFRHVSPIAKRLTWEGDGAPLFHSD